MPKHPKKSAFSRLASRIKSKFKSMTRPVQRNVNIGVNRAIDFGQPGKFRSTPTPSATPRPRANRKLRVPPDVLIARRQKIR